VAGNVRFFALLRMTVMHFSRFATQPLEREEKKRQEIEEMIWISDTD
jgi:hypothetical protein